MPQQQCKCQQQWHTMLAACAHLRIRLRSSRARGAAHAVGSSQGVRSRSGVAAVEGLRNGSSRGGCVGKRVLWRCRSISAASWLGHGAARPEGV